MTSKLKEYIKQFLKEDYSFPRNSNNRVKKNNNSIYSTKDNGIYEKENEVIVYYKVDEYNDEEGNFVYELKPKPEYKDKLNLSHKIIVTNDEVTFNHKKTMLIDKLCIYLNSKNNV